MTGWGTSFDRLAVFDAQITRPVSEKIMQAYEGVQKKPVIETTKNTFKVILPNINASYGSVDNGPSYLDPADRKKGYLSDEEKVLEYAMSQGVITRNDVIEL